MKQDILNRLNEIIIDEKGSPVKITDMFTDSQLDSLGTILTIITLETDYPFFKQYPKGFDVIENLDISNLTIRDLIKQCVLSITNTSQERKTEKSI